MSQVLGGEYPNDRRVTITPGYCNWLLQLVTATGYCNWLLQLVTATGYCNLALDHHTGIILVLRNRLYGSGLALARSVFEAMLRAHWMVGCAKDSEVNQVAEDAKKQ